MRLNNSQTEAVRHLNGPMLVLAGPGSGKTAVITARVLNLIKAHNVPEDKILVITFTKAAAAHMKHRFLRERGASDTTATFSTLHSLFYRILSKYAGLKPENIISEDKKYELIGSIIDRLGIKSDDKKELINQIILAISSVKSKVADINDGSLLSCEQNVLPRIYDLYEGFLKESRLLDMDDLMIYCYRLLRSSQSVLESCRSSYHYILVDEFQDICKMQYKIIRLIAHPADNLFVVGDDDQSIYAFRGAEPSIMLDFPKDYPNAASVLLNISYRSGEKLIAAADKVIKNNKMRYKKSLSSGQELDNKIFVVKAADVKSQNLYISEKILSENSRYKDYAVLCRTNREQLSIISHFISKNIPFSAKDSHSSIFNSFACLDILSYIRAAQQLKTNKCIDRGLFLRIMNKPVRYIERASLKSENVDLLRLQRANITKHWAFGKITQLAGDLKHLSQLTLQSAIFYILNDIGYSAYLKDYCDTNALAYDDTEEQIYELADICADFSDISQLDEFQRLYEAKMAENRFTDNAVTVSTFHSSKGLEFQNVIIINCVNGIIPYYKGKKLSACHDIEEERRLFYVGMTRAKSKLYIIIPERMYAKEKAPSIFVKELSE